MQRLGITGQSGFIGSHIFRMAALQKDIYENIIFDKSFFNDEDLLDAFVLNCDIIIHLAGLNRHKDQDVIYQTNIILTNQLIASLKRTKSKAKVIFSSSKQEGLDNLYGQSKRDCRKLLETWANEFNGKFTGLIIPNVFGPFCKPYYNSVIATFCYQLTNNQIPQINTDRHLELIYIGDLVGEILDIAKKEELDAFMEVLSTHTIKVSEILNLLEGFKNEYVDRGIIPTLNGQLELNLFNTFRSYINIKDIFPRKLTQHIDSRGSFVEIIKLNIGGQISFSTTKPGVVRGNHFHTRKIERFSVIKGLALIQLRKIGELEVLDLNLSGDEPSYVDMPVWYAHNIKNIGDEDLYTVFWINEFYDENNPDTYLEVV
jgi:UDP-2-acetamido-2,6-beta-L-arabino-hexul-4-ose reductase